MLTLTPTGCSKQTLRREGTVANGSTRGATIALM